MDDGWQQIYGENAVNKEHFPQGLEPVFAEADALGMKRGLWAPVALINSKAKAYVQHPEWACRDENGQPRLIPGNGRNRSRDVPCLPLQI